VQIVSADRRSVVGIRRERSFQHGGNDQSDLWRRGTYDKRCDEYGGKFPTTGQSKRTNREVLVGRGELRGHMLSSVEKWFLFFNNCKGGLTPRQQLVTCCRQHFLVMTGNIIVALV
jgi:hypothetical protein